MKKVNLACGGVYVKGSGWLNFDFVSTSPEVLHANLLGRLPLADSSLDLVYSSHFLEHIPRDLVAPFLRECSRILKPGGVLRLVVPDLENLCRTYLYYRDNDEHEKADFLVLELLDQCVRRQCSGDLGSYYRSLQIDPQANKSRIAFVRERTGDDLLISSPTPRRRSLKSMLRRIPVYAERLRIFILLQALPRAFREQNVSMTHLGERHHWLYDFYSLQNLLSGSGFVSVDRHTACTSRLHDFPFYPLDLDVDGQPRKGLESLFVEAQKPMKS